MLMLLWTSSAALVTTSLLVLTTLVVRRAALARAGRDRAARRKELTLYLFSVLENPHLDMEGLSELPCDRDLLADIGIELLDLVRGDDRVRYAAVLSRLGVEDVLLTRVRRASGPRRASAAEALAAFPGARVTAALQRVLQDRDPEARISAAIALVELDSTADLEGLLRRVGSKAANSRRIVRLVERVARDRPEAALKIATDVSAAVTHRLAAIEALGTLREQTAAQPLADLAREPGDDLRGACLRALGTIGHPVANDVIATSLHDEVWHVRANGAEAAGRIGLTRMSGRLGELLDDSNWWVRFRAGEALAALGRAGHAELRLQAAGPLDRAAQTAALILAEHAVPE